jgi:hypothetical protein
MCRRLGIEGECSTEVRRKSGWKMRGMVGDGRGGVGMRYEVEGVWNLVKVEEAGLPRTMS